LYDHVVPPEACPPDMLSSQFNTYGIRVPLLVVSPYAKRHHVSHRIYDHTSIVRFVEARFVMPALTHRDANAEAPWDMFDFANPTPEPPAFALPEPNPQKLADCQAIFEP
jgi:phospholipase C